MSKYSLYLQILSFGMSEILGSIVPPAMLV